MPHFVQNCTGPIVDQHWLWISTGCGSALDMLPDLKVRGFSGSANRPSGLLYGWLDKAVGLPETPV